VTGRGSLLAATQALLERTYRIPQGLVRAERFVIGDRGLRDLYRERSVHEAGSPVGQGARMLVREVPDGARVCVYFPDAMIRALERRPPWHGVGDDNVDPFATLVEEVDHLLTVADRAASGRPVSLFELELHANVSKWLVVGRFVAGRRRRLTDRERVWLRWHLFLKHRFVDEDAAIRGRYRDATRHALRFVDGLLHTRPSRRLGLLRAFHDATASDKVRLIGELAA
jgi:hypothetical protein